MIKKKFKLSSVEVEAHELSVGVMKKVKKMLEVDDMEATLFMVESAIDEDSDFVDNLYMSDIKLISDWLVDPTAD